MRFAAHTALQKLFITTLLTVSAAFSGNVFAALPGSEPGEQALGYFTDLELVTQDGEKVHFYSDLLKDRVVLISGYYINCDTVSPRQNLVLSRLQKKLGALLGQEVLIVSVSVDPQNDTPAKVHDYARVFLPRPGWLFLTGSPENVDEVNMRLGQYHRNPEQHLGIYLLGNLKTGLWMKVSPQAQVDELYNRLRELLNDRGDSR
ncbi:SCO family protein [Desulfuromonas versatilis]|uniref:SCO family protein n=1 Tax=Desulfuromonas versatilis TaxID=2802975 RepID=A0ABN6DWH6_9BACT|nr:SCO family protein [Desulfuromonas versatilis]BCR04425.1 SCO family protein [Desulfuromonas versatilis]